MADHTMECSKKPKNTLCFLIFHRNREICRFRRFTNEFSTCWIGCFLFTNELETVGPWHCSDASPGRSAVVSSGLATNVDLGGSTARTWIPSHQSPLESRNSSPWQGWTTGSHQLEGLCEGDHCRRVAKSGEASFHEQGRCASHAYNVQSPGASWQTQDRDASRNDVSAGPPDFDCSA